MSWSVLTPYLAPGDAKSAALDLSQFDVVRIRSTEHPLFEEAYSRLWEEFGARDEMERREVLEQRFQLGSRFHYEMILVRAGGEFMAVRDHTATMTRDNLGVVVHLSHNLVAPQARRTGLAGWMRTLPLLAAYECIAANPAPLMLFTPITLLAEMEYPQPGDAAAAIRLQAYERAGFRKIDPQMIHFFQPDFRTPAIIDTTGGPRPLPFQLIVRRVRRELEQVIKGAEVRQLAETLYDIYRPQFRAADMAHPALSLDAYPPDDALIALVPPTQC